ncbi:hypothetical protein Tsubulata_025112, partial [Turnera subulata]
ATDSVKALGNERCKKQDCKMALHKALRYLDEKEDTDEGDHKGALLDTDFVMSGGRDNAKAFFRQAQDPKKIPEEDSDEAEESEDETNTEREEFRDPSPGRVHSFKDFLLKPELLRALVEQRFERPSKGEQYYAFFFQVSCLPLAILGKDVICQAKSGTGKTAAFVLSTLQQIEPTTGQVSALVLVNSREMAYQICREFERFGKYLPQISVLNGDVHGDLLESPHIVVGTPQRILSLSRNNGLSLNNVRHFILDNVEEIHEGHVQQIFQMTPRGKQMMVFSATLRQEIRAAIRNLTNDPMEIYFGGAELNLRGFVQHYIRLTEAEKNRKLNDLLDAVDFNQVVIFVSSLLEARAVEDCLRDCNFEYCRIDRDMSEERRLESYKRFKEGSCRILVTTDIVGMPTPVVERVNVVINHGMPGSADTYLRRQGQSLTSFVGVSAARFGGGERLAVSFVSSEADSTVLNQVQESVPCRRGELLETVSACPDPGDTVSEPKLRVCVLKRADDSSSLNTTASVVVVDPANDGINRLRRIIWSDEETEKILKRRSWEGPSSDEEEEEDDDEEEETTRRRRRKRARWKRRRVVQPAMEEEEKEKEKLREFDMNRLTDDLVMEILLRLPLIKVALECKKVCNRWDSIISSPGFVPLFLDRHYYEIVGYHHEIDSIEGKSFKDENIKDWLKTMGV